jgi:hypothetical protein
VPQCCGCRRANHGAPAAALGRRARSRGLRAIMWPARDQAACAQSGGHSPPKCAARIGGEIARAIPLSRRARQRSRQEPRTRPDRFSPSAPAAFGPNLGPPKTMPKRRPRPAAGKQALPPSRRTRYGTGLWFNPAALFKWAKELSRRFMARRKLKWRKRETTPICGIVKCKMLCSHFIIATTVSAGPFFRMARTRRSKCASAIRRRASASFIPANAEAQPAVIFSQERGAPRLGCARMPPGLRLGQAVTVALEIAAAAGPIARRMCEHPSRKGQGSRGAMAPMPVAACPRGPGRAARRSARRRR